MSTCGLIGATGFVGGNLQRQRSFDACYHSVNIDEIGNELFDLVICAAPSAVKWLANKHPDDDRAHVDRLLADLETVRTRRFVLVSTVDVYPIPIAVDESTPIEPGAGQPYGRHRRDIELRVRELFENTLTVRLPQLFGPGLKKNFVYDLMYDNALHLIDHRSILQFYPVTRLSSDIDAALAAGREVVNLAVEPATTGLIARQVFDIDFDNETEHGPVHYDLRSNDLGFLGRSSPYVMDREAWFESMRQFVTAERERSA